MLTSAECFIFYKTPSLPSSYFIQAATHWYFLHFIGEKSRTRWFGLRPSLLSSSLVLWKLYHTAGWLQNKGGDIWHLYSLEFSARVTTIKAQRWVLEKERSDRPASQKHLAGKRDKSRCAITHRKGWNNASATKVPGLGSQPSCSSVLCLDLQDLIWFSGSQLIGTLEIL